MICFREFGKNVPKSFKLSPDGFIQCAIQLAYYKCVSSCSSKIVTLTTMLLLYRMYNHPTAAYESGATRWFKYGRTDTIRSTTNAALTFVKTMCDPQASVSLTA